MFEITQPTNQTNELKTYKLELVQIFYSDMKNHFFDVFPNMLKLSRSEFERCSWFHTQESIMQWKIKRKQYHHSLFIIILSNSNKIIFN